MADIWSPNNPGISGLRELTSTELLLIQSLGELGDPNADRILFWDDSAGGYAFLTAGTGITITGTTISASSSTPSLDGLTDVTITTPADNELLAYNSSTNSWINQTSSEAGFSAVATSGAYSDLSGTPTIPSTFDDLTDGTTNKAFTSTEKTKLAGIASGATAYTDTDADARIAAASIDDLSDVDTSTVAPTDGQILTWDAVGSKWKPELAAGTGDMLAATYDPNAIAADAFDQDNMVDGTTNKNYTATEKTKLAGIAAGAEVNTVDSVNTFTGAVVLDADDIDDTATTNKFTTAADITKLAGIESGADVTDATNVGSSIHGATAKTTPVDADELPLIDSAASNVLKKLTWSNLKATLKTYLDTLYQPLDSDLTTWAGKTAPSGTVVGTSDSQTLTNKRNEPRTSSSASTTTLTPSLSTANVYILTAQAASLTIANPTGTPVTGEVLVIYVTDNGTSRTLSFGTQYTEFGAALPTATTASKTLMIVCQYLGSSVWAVVTSEQQ